MALVHEGMLIMMQLYFIAAATITTLLAADSIALPQAKPECQEKCGDLIIPYPFGIGQACSMRPEFTITCYQSTTGAPPSAKLSNSTFTFPNTISNFSLFDGELQVMQDVAEDCYDVVKGDNTLIDLQLPPSFTISTRNDFFTIGCNVLGLFEEDLEENYEKGTNSPVCFDVLGNLTDSCTGYGCSRITVPGGMQNVSIVVENIYKFNASDPWQSKYMCSYAFIVEDGNFAFDPESSFQQLKTTRRQLPVAVNWVAGEESCEEASKNLTAYSCKGNASCVDRSNITDGMVGYTCECWQGYEGNPYLGCQDIDECKVSNPCAKGTCQNLPGSYSCLCDRGYISNGTDLQSCIQKISNNQPKATRLLIVSLSTGGSLGLIFLVISAWWFDKVIKKRKNRRRKEKCFKQNGGLVLQQQLSSGDQANVEKIKLFNSRELKKATDYFSSDRILGQGGQGTVYKGMLTDGQIVAVKKSKIVNGGEVGQFINEIVILSQINHRNVVKLLGCCLETEVPLLVYEYLPNGTLSRYIHDQDEEFPLTWGKRLRVSAEVAGALSYLHSAASIPIYHRDIKCTNILLDAKYRAKIADFGTSRSVSVDQTHLTTLVHGTFGYLDPEYFQSSQFTEKSDVYSFGVVLAELLTGQKPVSVMRQHESRSLATHFLLSMEQNRLFDILDPQVMKDGIKEEIIVVANLAQRCLNLNGRKRPTMKQVAAELERIRLAAKDADDHVQQNLVEERDVGTHEIQTMDYCDVVSMSTAGPFTDGGTVVDSSFDVQPLLFYNTQ